MSRSLSLFFFILNILLILFKVILRGFKKFFRDDFQFACFHRDNGKRSRYRVRIILETTCVDPYARLPHWFDIDNEGGAGTTNCQPLPCFLTRLSLFNEIIVWKVQLLFLISIVVDHSSRFKSHVYTKQEYFFILTT